MKKLIPFSAFAFIVLTCVFSAQCTKSASDALNMCLYTLLPSLFPFFVFSRIFILSGGADLLAKKLAFVTKPLFNMSGGCIVPIILGILCGYPVGAKTAAELYGEGVITKDEAQRLCGFCNNSGPLFLIGAVGTGMLMCPSAGILLYTVHILSALSVGIIFRGKGIDKKSIVHGRAPKNTSVNENIFVAAVEESVGTILNVFGYVIFFAVLTSFVKNPFIVGIFEITNALKKISLLDFPLWQKFVFSAFFSSWGGLSVHMQTYGILSKYSLSLKKYVSAKFIHSVFAFVYALIAIKIVPLPFKTFSSAFEKTAVSLNIASLVCTVILGIYLFYLNIILLRHKNGKDEKI